MTETVKGGGERLDRLAKRLMQTERRGSVEALLFANPGLAAASVDGVAPAGWAVNLPAEVVDPAAPSVVLPWE